MAPLGGHNILLRTMTVGSRGTQQGPIGDNLHSSATISGQVQSTAGVRVVEVKKGEPSEGPKIFLFFSFA